MACWTDSSAIRASLGPSWGHLVALFANCWGFFEPGSSRGGCVSDPPPGTPPGGEGIKGKGLPFDSTTTLFDFSVADRLEEEGAGKGDGGRRRRRVTETTRRPRRRRLERTSPSHTPTGSADFSMQEGPKRASRRPRRTPGGPGAQSKLGSSPNNIQGLERRSRSRSKA